MTDAYHEGAPTPELPQAATATRIVNSVTVDAPSSISVAIDPVALVTSECITVTSAMRKNARWAQSSVAAILGGGGGSGYDSNGSNTPVPGSPKPGLATRRGKLADGELDADVGLAGRWGLRGKKGKSIQDNPLMAAFARLRGDLQGCKG
jgi:brefeldin A-resistance guanine nucleotide exchange factor 1